MAQLLILLGVLLIVLLGGKALLVHLQLPPIAGYLILGWLLHQVSENIYNFSPTIDLVLNVLAQMGIVFLLFHIGLESHFKRLLRLINQAGLIAISNIVLSGVLGFLAAWLFEFSFATSLFVGVALTATSIGVSTGSWNKKALTTKKEGALLLDLVTIDDIVGILLMALLFSLVARGNIDQGLVLLEVMLFLLKIVLFVGAGYLFSHFIEPSLMNKLIKYEKMPDSMLCILGIGLVIAGIASLLHFSFAIGAFFAGIAFSRDSKAVKMDASMQTLLDFFVPFFFFWIGFRTSLISIGDLWPFFFVLLFAAIFGKIAGTYLPAKWAGCTTAGALMIAVSMIPRAEITLIIMEHGLDLGVISEQIYTIFALISFVTCIFTPFCIKSVQKWEY